MTLHCLQRWTATRSVKHPYGRISTHRHFQKYPSAFPCRYRSRQGHTSTCLPRPLQNWEGSADQSRQRRSCNKTSSLVQRTSRPYTRGLGDTGQQIRLADPNHWKNVRHNPRGYLHCCHKGKVHNPPDIAVAKPSSSECGNARRYHNLTHR